MKKTYYGIKAVDKLRTLITLENRVEMLLDICTVEMCILYVNEDKAILKPNAYAHWYILNKHNYARVTVPEKNKIKSAWLSDKEVPSPLCKYDSIW